MKWPALFFGALAACGPSQKPRASEEPPSATIEPVTEDAPAPSSEPSATAPATVPASGWAAKLGQTITVRGKADNAMTGPLVLLDGDEQIWIADFDAWKEEVRGKRVE